MESTKTYDEVMDEMVHNREALVEALHVFNGEANAQELRKQGGIPRGSMYDLTALLEEWDVIEQVGQEPIGRGGHANVYRFTDFGETIRGGVVDDDSMTVDEMQDLSKQVEHLSTLVETIEESIESHREVIKDHEEELDELHDRYEEVEEPLMTVEKFIREQQEKKSVES